MDHILGVEAWVCVVGGWSASGRRWRWIKYGIEKTSKESEEVDHIIWGVDHIGGPYCGPEELL